MQTSDLYNFTIYLKDFTVVFKRNFYLYIYDILLSLLVGYSDESSRSDSLSNEIPDGSYSWYSFHFLGWKQKDLLWMGQFFPRSKEKRVSWSKLSWCLQASHLHNCVCVCVYCVETIWIWRKYSNKMITSAATRYD